MPYTKEDTAYRAYAPYALPYASQLTAYRAYTPYALPASPEAYPELRRLRFAKCVSNPAQWMTGEEFGQIFLWA